MNCDWCVHKLFWPILLQPMNSAGVGCVILHDRTTRFYQLDPLLRRELVQYVRRANAQPEPPPRHPVRAWLKMWAQFFLGFGWCELLT